MIGASELLHVVDLLYASALSGDWAPPLRAAAALFGSEQAGLFRYDIHTHGPRAIALAGIEPIYQDGYAPVATRPEMDPVWAEAIAEAAKGSTIIERYAADAELSRTNLYQEWLRPQHIDQSIEVYALVAPRVMAMVAVARPANATDFDNDAILAMRMLQPHLQRAMQVRQRLDAIDLERQQALGALDHLEQGVLMVDAQARVRHANRVGEALLQRGDGLATDSGVLGCEQAADSRALRRHIGAAAAGILAAPEAALAVRRSAGRPLSVQVAPLRHDDPWQHGSPASAIVVVTDPERARASGAAELASRYGLTAAEAGAALALLDGGGLSAVADRLSVRLSTVRTLVQRAFAKTGTHRQAELVRLIAAPEPPTGDAA